MKNVTISDIANQLGVSKTTVSFVLNGRGDERNISKSTQDRIINLAEELNFKPSILARSLKNGRTFTIGYLVPDISNPFYAMIGRKLEDRLLQEGYHLFMGSTDENPDKEKGQIRSLLSRQVDGMIIASSDVKNVEIMALIKQNYPLVLFDRFAKGVEANFILVENKLSMKREVIRLFDQGKKKIGILSITPEIYSIQNRISGYLEAVKERGKKDKTELIRTIDKDNIRESTKVEMKELFKLNVDAMVFTNNLVAQEAIWNINTNFTEYLDKISFVSFDDISLFDYSLPPVTSLAQPVDEIADKIMELLLEQVKSSTNTQKQHIELNPKTINRTNNI